jgi:hypothetical protein
LLLAALIAAASFVDGCRVRQGAALDLRPEPRRTHSIQGQLLRQSERREVAIFLRDGALWVADFIDGQGVLIDAITWFRFNCGSPSTWHARRRMVLESAVPLPEELVQRIERLHRPATMRKHSALVRLVEAIAAHRRQSRLAMLLVHRFGRGRVHRVKSERTVETR